MSAVLSRDHGWRGRGPLRIALIDGALIVRSTMLGTRAGRVAEEMRSLIRSFYRRLRPAMGLFSVHIFVVGGGERMDVDNVAKAWLDALTGFVWHDDRQVARLLVERVDGAAVDMPPSVIVTARRIDDSTDAAGQLAALLARVAALP